MRLWVKVPLAACVATNFKKKKKKKGIISSFYVEIQVCFGYANSYETNSLCLLKMQIFLWKKISMSHNLF